MQGSREKPPPPAPSPDGSAELAPGTLLAGRYEIKKVLGHGGQSDVYWVSDRERVRDVALKILRPASVTRAYMLKQEFAALASLNHPHIVHVHEFGTFMPEGPAGAAKLSYYTMDLIGGRDFTTATRDMPLELFIDVLQQALSALAHVHASELLHADIKPENLLVEQRPNGAWLTLVDFGLAQRRRASPTGFARGTLGYIAPEMLAGEAVDARADLYSLGRVVYATLARVDVSDDPGAPLPLLERARPDLPKALCAFVDRLAAASADARFPRAQAALLELRNIAPLPEADNGEAQHGALLVPRMVGRAQELAQARKLIGHALQKKRFAALIVSAPPGHGKSVFTQGLQALISAQELRAVADDRLSAERKLSPEGDTLEAIEERARGLTATLASWPVWIIDDGDLLSDVAVSVLSRLFEHAANLGACVVVTVTHTSATAPWQLLEIEHQPRLGFIELGPLGKRELQALATSLLGNALPDGWLTELHSASAGNPLWAQELLRGWVSEAQLVFRDGSFTPAQSAPPAGDRSRISELVHGRVASIDEELWPAIFAAAILGREVSPEKVTRLASLWVRKNDNPAEKIVAMAFEAMLQRHLLEHGTAGVDKLATQGVDKRAADPKERYRFVHDELLEALRALIPEQTRRKLHTQAAGLFKSKQDADVRDFHLVRGVDPFVAADAALSAGDRSRAGFAYRRAWRRYRRGYHRIANVDPHKASELALCMAECAAAIDEQKEGLEWFEKARALAPEDVDIVTRVELGMADAHRKRCEYREAMTHANAALKLVPVSSSSHAAALRLIARLEQHLGDMDAALQHFTDAHAMYAALDHDEGLTRTELDLAQLHTERGRISAAEAHAQAAETTATAMGDDGLRARAFQQLGHILCLKGESLLALEYSSEARQLAHTMGDRRTEGAALRDIATLRRQQGRLHEAKELLEKASRLFFVTGAKNLQSDCLYQLGIIETRAGDFVRAFTALAQALAIRRDLKDIVGRSHAHIALGRLHLELGMYREALHYGELALREAKKSGDPLLLLLAEETLVATEIEFGEHRPKLLEQLARRAQATGIARVEVSILCRLVTYAPSLALSERLEALGTSADNHEARTHAAWCRALFYERTPETAHLASAEFASALAMAEGAGQRELIARLQGDWGDHLWKTGRKQQAKTLLTQAMLTLRDHYAALGAKRNAGYLNVPWRRQLRDRFRRASE